MASASASSWLASLDGQEHRPTIRTKPCGEAGSRIGRGSGTRSSPASGIEGTWPTATGHAPPGRYHLGTVRPCVRDGDARAAWGTAWSAARRQLRNAPSKASPARTSRARREGECQASDPSKQCQRGPVRRHRCAAQPSAEGRQCGPTVTRPSDSSPVGVIRVAAIGSSINFRGLYPRVRVYVRTPGGAVRAPPLDRRPGVR
jgi:hypothetical protein